MGFLEAGTPLPWTQALEFAAYGEAEDGIGGNGGLIWKSVLCRTAPLLTFIWHCPIFDCPFPPSAPISIPCSERARHQAVPLHLSQSQGQDK